MLVHVDGSAGASGDMLLAAFIDAGYTLGELRSVVAALGLADEVGVETERVAVADVMATRLHVRTAERRRRQYGAMTRAIEDASLARDVRDASLGTLRRLAEVEAEIHGVPLAQLHLHELSGADTLVDIVGFHAARRALGITALTASVLNVGGGTVTFSHGTFPVPAPATASLLRDVPTVRDPEVPVELLTPTAAALLVTTVRSFGAPAPSDPSGVGYAVGSRVLPRPRVLRVIFSD